MASQQASPKPVDDAPHLIVVARAGTGKTTTLIEGLKILKGIGSKLTPSPQQQAVWDEIAKSPASSSCCFVAFNRSIAGELKERVPPGVEAMTMHSMGMKAVNRAFPRLKVNEYRVQDIISAETGIDCRQLRREEPVLLKAVDELVGLCKMNLVGWSITDADGMQWEVELQRLADHYGVELNGCRRKAFDLVPQVLGRCKDPKRDGCMNFDDMIWLPIALNLPVFRYDLLLVDEAQDLNRCQQELAKRAGRRLILCGDPKQAIYGFAGADNESMNRMGQELGRDCPRCGRTGGRAKTPCEECGYQLNWTSGRGCITLPLTVTRRCGKAIVEEARKFVPDFEAHESNPEGFVDETGVYPTDKDGKLRPEPHYVEKVQDGDFILCRTNAPLVRECFRFIKQGRRANIQGRDVGAGLVSTIRKLWGKAWDYEKDKASIPDLIQRLTDWHAKEASAESAKRNPSQSRIQGLDDRLECLLCFTQSETVKTPVDVVQRIEMVFTDDKSIRGIRLSSIHKAKGLEAERVFILQPPTGGMRTDKMQRWELEQEDNLRYVSITRAIKELVYVR